MSSQHSLQIDELPEQSIVEYLRRHPNFFMQYENLLAEMVIPQSRGNMVSLVERQMVVLRDENQQLQRKLSNLIEMAQRNELLNQRIQRFVVNLSGAGSLDEFFSVLYENLLAEFNSDAVVVRLFELPAGNLAGRKEFVEYDAQVFSLFESLLSSSKPFCGRLAQAQIDYLFPNENITSAALIPLGIPKPQGILAMGSRDISRFHAGMGTDLIQYMGEVISQLLKRWLKPF